MAEGSVLDVVSLSAVFNRAAAGQQFATTSPAKRGWAAPCSALPAVAAAFDFAVLIFAALAGEFAYRILALGESPNSAGSM